MFVLTEKESRVLRSQICDLKGRGLYENKKGTLSHSFSDSYYFFLSFLVHDFFYRFHGACHIW